MSFSDAQTPIDPAPVGPTHDGARDNPMIIDGMKYYFSSDNIYVTNDVPAHIEYLFYLNFVQLNCIKCDLNKIDMKGNK